MPDQDAAERLREEILAEARRDRDDILLRARREAEALVAKAAAEAARLRQERLEQSRAEAVRRKEMILARVPVEAGRLRAARMQALLESIHDEAHRRLKARDGFDHRAVVATLAAEAISQMHGSAFVVKLSPADRAAFGDELPDALTRLAGRTLSLEISNDTALMEPGVIVQDTAGSQVWDNRLLARLERMWAELRRQIAVQTALVSGRKSAGGGG
jgi:vacuolar-type H+-ATPase subunit E/Vma4